MTNPFRTDRGFGLRVKYVANAIRAYGSNPLLKSNFDKVNNNRSFDNCFENSDADALVYAIMEKVFEHGDIKLEKGIQAMGVNLNAQWTELYRQAKDRQMALF